MMNFNVYLDDDLARRLAALAKRTGARRNALVRQAVANLVASTSTSWPEAVLAWTGDASVAPFESFRRELSEPNDDPFAPTPSRPRRRRR